jgi:hypothetical protein
MPALSPGPRCARRRPRARRRLPARDRRACAPRRLTRRSGRPSAPAASTAAARLVLVRSQYCRSLSRSGRRGAARDQPQHDVVAALASARTNVRSAARGVRWPHGSGRAVDAPAAASSTSVSGSPCGSWRSTRGATAPACSPDPLAVAPTVSAGSRPDRPRTPRTTFASGSRPTSARRRRARRRARAPAPNSCSVAARPLGLGARSDAAASPRGTAQQCAAAHPRPYPASRGEAAIAREDGHSGRRRRARRVAGALVTVNR